MGKGKPSKKKLAEKRKLRARSLIAQKKAYLKKHGKSPLAHNAAAVAIHNSKRKNLTV